MELEEAQPKKLPYPKAVGFIVANEFCERFNYYGMRTILSLYLLNKTGQTEEGATLLFHVFSMLCYFFPVFGAIIADSWWGKYRTIMYLSMVYAAGSILIALTAIPPLGIPVLEFTILSMVLIAVGTGGIKPCVAAFGGDQFKLPEQERYLNYYFSVFYFAINSGSLISTFLTPILRSVNCYGEDGCYSLAFGVPGILMIVSIVLFVGGHRMYIIKPPLGVNLLTKVSACIVHSVTNKCKSKEKREHWLDYADDKYEKKLIEDIKALLRVLVLFIPIPVFWALFDQQGSRWTFQANRMDQDLFWGLTIKADQMQVLNPLLILLFLPLFDIVIYPFLAWTRIVTKPLHKILAGGVLAGAAFVISGFVELALVPTYETPLVAGYSQLRVYNGYNCQLTLNAFHATHNIGPLDQYENLYVPVEGMMHEPYILQVAGNDTRCGDFSTITGTFALQEKTANSFFVNQSAVTDFIDDPTKPINEVHIRFLVNSNQIVPIRVIDSNGKEILTAMSDSRKFHYISGGTYSIQINNRTVSKDVIFKTGGAYSINVYDDGNNNFELNSVLTTPWNSVHILWQVPQYVVMTMGEVMLSVTGLSFSFTQAPASMKSVVQSAWLLTVAFGNIIVIIIVKGHVMDAQWKEFFLFAGLMGLDMLLFAFLALRFKYKETESNENLAVDSSVSQETKKNGTLEMSEKVDKKDNTNKTQNIEPLGKLDDTEKKIDDL